MKARDTRYGAAETFQPSHFVGKKSMQTQNQRMEEIRGGCLRRVFPLLLGMSTARLAVDSPWFEITRHQFRFARHSEAFHGYRIVHITDIHADDEFMIP